MPSQTAIEARYKKAVEDLVDKVQQDRKVLAAILFGSMAYDQVWERSDIDLWLVMEDDKTPHGERCLTENGVIIHAQLVPRSRFKRMLEGQRAGGWLDFTFARSRLLFTRDPSIEAWYAQAEHIGARDLQIQLLRNTIEALSTYAKAEKWCYLKKDYRYSFTWIVHLAGSLAAIETLLHGEAPGREVIHQGLKHNPEFFEAVYARLMDEKKTRKNIEAALQRIDAYLEEQAPTLCRPILDYLQEAGAMRTLSEMHDHFAKANIGGLDFACEWLAEKDLIARMSAPLHLTPKSRVQVEEAAYYYDGEATDW